MLTCTLAPISAPSFDQRISGMGSASKSHSSSNESFSTIEIYSTALPIILGGTENCLPLPVLSIYLVELFSFKILIHK